jgi:hypothetical protein
MRLALIDEDKCWWHIANASSTYRHELEMKRYSYDPKDKLRTPEQFGRDYSIMMMSTTTYSWGVSKKAYDKIVKAIEKIVAEETNDENKQVREDKLDGVAEETGEREGSSGASSFPSGDHVSSCGES